MNNKTLGTTTKRDLKSIKVLLMRAEAMMTDIISNNNNTDLQYIYRQLASVTSKINEIGL